MKAFAWAALALMAACLGCTQGGSKGAEGSTASRLQKLETSFESFQQDQLLTQKQRQAHDAEIDAKLSQIATRLDGLTLGAKPAKVAQPAKPARYTPAGGTEPLVAGQVVPLSAFGTPPAAQGMSPQPVAQAPAPQAPASQPMSPQPQPVATAPRGATPMPMGQPAGRPGTIQPGQVMPLQSAQPQPQTQPQPVQNSLGLEPPVVTLTPQQQAPQSYAAQTPYTSPSQPAQARKPVAYDSAAKSGTGRGKTQAAGSKSAPEASVASAPAGSAAPATPTAAPASPGQNDPVEAAQLYADGMRSIAANKNDDGRRKMNELLTKYPGTDKAPLALYWVGESYMNERSYNQAILAFKDLTTRYPKSFKAPESVYKVAEAYERLGDKSNAIFHLKLLVDEYPGSELAGKAKQKLKQLGQ